MGHPRDGGAGLRKADLHRSLSEPVLDTLNFLNEIAQRHPGAISFAPGRPYDGFFDTEQMITHLRSYLDHLAGRGYSAARVRDALFQYGPAGGQIRELVADFLRESEGVDVPPEAVVVTVGAQEAMLLTLRALMARPDDTLLVATPCFPGIVGAAELLDVEVTAVDEGPAGFDCAELEARIRNMRAQGRRPRACYVIPDHSNPSGTTMSVEQRHALLELAIGEDILIIEDSPYRLVSPGRRLPTLKTLDRTRSVIHLGSFAKTLFPGARVGYVVADQPVVADRPVAGEGLLAQELTKIKSMVTVNTSAVSQAIVGGMLLAAKGDLAAANAETASYYGAAMSDTLRCLDAALPEADRAELGVSWNRPSGGFFLVVRVPFETDDAALVRSTEKFGVIWTPMAYFYPGGGGERALRLSVSYLSAAEIEEGVARLARFIRAEAGAPCPSPQRGHPARTGWHRPPG